MDPSEYREFRATGVDTTKLTLYKVSNHQSVEIPTNAIREIVAGVNGGPAVLQLRGHLRWLEDVKLWKFDSAG